MDAIQTFDAGNGKNVDIDTTKVDVDELKTRLTDGEVKFGARSGVVRLINLAFENEIEVPMEEDSSKTGNVVGKGYREKYGKSQHCGDDIAHLLRDELDKMKSGEERSAKLDEIATANDIDLGRWSHLNLGMQRMNLGNVLRGKVNNGTDVRIGKTTIAGQNKADADAEQSAGKL